MAEANSAQVMADTFIHSTALVETQHVGRGTRIWAFAHIMSDVSIGENCNIGDHCFIESGVSVGNNVTIKNGNMLWAGVALEDGVFVGPQVFFTNDLYPRSPRLPEASHRYHCRDWLAPTLVKYGASLGAGAVILAGATVGEFALVGAGAVVTKDIPPHALVTGNPARVRGWVCHCGKPLKLQDDSATCRECSKVFQMYDASVRFTRKLEELL